MKIRTDFVTNSSSSSFVISRKDITDEQIELLKNHADIIKHFGYEIPGLEYSLSDDYWDISIDDDSVSGYTSMDNWNFYKFLEYIGLDMTKVQYNHD